MTRPVHWRRAALGILLAAALAPDARAQTPAAAARPAAPRADRGIDVTVGGAWTGGTSFGSSNATLQAPDGSSLTLFTTSSELGAGSGFELHLGFRVTKTLNVEASGSWSRAELRTAVTSDFEDAAPVTATNRVSRFTLEGSALWTVLARGRARWFVRGGVGWQRELDETQVLTDDGTIANLGGGVKYWWRQHGRGVFGNLGFRAEARAAFRSSGLSLDQKQTRVSPVIAGGVMFGF
ncbi:MAG TPA: hypothetical protein VLT86_14320 [Vicinamibacterales bacterium]|nr:hypothetical protein [Vicinamibacterales bacterium]